MTWPERMPMPDPPARFTVERAEPCTCAVNRDGTPRDESMIGLVEDECWSPEFHGDDRDPTWPGHGYLICGFCDGDGWLWREVDPDTFTHVWINAGRTRYHRIETCAGGRPSRLLLADAQAAGIAPCKQCVGTPIAIAHTPT